MNRVAEFTNILSVFQWIRIVLRHGVDLFFYIATAFLLQLQNHLL
jgi:hypothetical protein